MKISSHHARSVRVFDYRSPYELVSIFFSHILIRDARRTEHNGPTTRGAFGLFLPIVVALASWTVPANAENLQKEGARFEGEVVVKWLREDGDDRKMELLQPFAFIDVSGKSWNVPAGTVVDGASIPRILWTLVGAPFVGNYRDASVVHDYFCVKKSEAWQKVHRMFFDASVAGGVTETKAKIMYAGVYARGPRWPRPGVLGSRIEPLPSVTDEELQTLNIWIESTNPSLDEIEEMLSGK